MPRKPKSDNCLGQTYAQFEAQIILTIASDPEFKDLPEESYTVEYFLDNGVIKRCSNHPDHFIPTPEARRVARDLKKLGYFDKGE